MLQNTEMTFEEIAVATGTDFNLVADINQGKRTNWINKNNISTPIRSTVKKTKVSIALAEQIIQLLKKNDMSADEIGQYFGIPGYTVGSINRETQNLQANNRRLPYSEKTA